MRESRVEYPSILRVNAPAFSFTRERSRSEDAVRYLKEIL